MTADDWRSGNVVYEDTGEVVELAKGYNFPHASHFAVVAHPTKGVGVCYYFKTGDPWKRGNSRAILKQPTLTIEDWRL